jgi:hypothetical protein
MENECIFTRAAKRADRNASDMLAMSSTWLGSIEAVRVLERDARTAFQEATAARMIANARLDDACRSFGRSLATDLKNDRTSARWKRFFRGTVDEFVTQPLVDQADACIAWLEIDDPALTPFREELTHWAHAAKAAITATGSSGQVRGTAIVAREALAENLTRARDGLHAALVVRAQERNLPRDFADGFFIVSSRKTGKGPKNG